MKLTELFHKKKLTDEEYYSDSTQKWLPIKDVKNGVVILKDGRYIKILEVLPVNFYLKSETEQQNIIYYFSSYLKIAPDRMQIRVFTQKSDISEYLNRLNAFLQSEGNGACADMIADEMDFVESLSYNVAVKKRFFIVFEFVPKSFDRTYTFSDVVRELGKEEDKARKYLFQCGLETVDTTDDTFLIDLLHTIINKNTSKDVKLGNVALDMLDEIHTFEGGFVDYD